MDSKKERLLTFIAPALVSGTPPTMKDVFDNLRNYPILAVMMAASSLIPKSHTSVSIAVLYFWTPVLGSLLFLSACQTALLSTACFAHFISATPTFRSRFGQLAAVAVGVLIFFLAIAGALEMVVALKSLRGSS